MLDTFQTASEVDKDEQETIFRRREGAVVVPGQQARGQRFPIHPTRRHPSVERGLKGRDQLRKRVERQAGEIEEVQRAGLQRGEPYTSHGSCLVSRYRDVRGASYHKAG